jgi:hypothetical protein
MHDTTYDTSIVTSISHAQSTWLQLNMISGTIKYTSEL